MKKHHRLVVVGISLAMIFSTTFSSAFAAYTKDAVLDYSGISITLDGETITPKDVNGNTVDPFIIDGTTYLPVRAVADALGLSVTWDGATKTVFLKSNVNQAYTNDKSNVDQKTTGFMPYTKQATLHYDNIIVNLDGNNLTLKDANGKTVEPFIIDGTTYLPVRAITEALNLLVNWDGDTKTVGLYTTKEPQTPPETPKASPEATPAGTSQILDPTGKDPIFSKLTSKVYNYSTKYYNYIFLEITNNSEYDICLSANVKFYNGDALVGAKGDTQYAFEAGTQRLLTFSVDEEVTEISSNYTAKQEDFYSCVDSTLSYETVSAKNKEIVTVTNNGDKTAEFVRGDILFFNGDILVDHGFAFFNGNDFKLNPGTSISKEISCYEPYTSVKFYISSRSSD